MMSGAVVSRACDQCHARKVKCDGHQPCGRCERGSVHCSFENPVLPKGPAPRDKRRGSRAASRTARSVRASSSTPRPVKRRADATSPYYRASTGGLARVDDAWGPGETADELLQWLAGQTQPAASGPAPSASAWLADLAPLEADPTWMSSALVLSRPPSRQGHVVDFGGSPELAHGLGLGLGLGLGASAPWTSTFAAAPSTITAPLADPCAPSVSPLLALTLDTLVRPQLACFFARVYPMIPVLSAADVHGLLAAPLTRASAALVLAMVALSLIHPLEPAELAARPARLAQARAVLDEVCRLRAHWDFGERPTLEHALTSFLMFGALFEMGLATAARLRLVEAVAIGRAMRLGDADAYRGLEPSEAGRRMRMYWVLAVTERAYALQRSGTIAFDGPICRPIPDACDTSLPYLARVFSLVDADLLTCWQGSCRGGVGGGGVGGVSGGGCTRLSRARAVAILRALKGSAANVFGEDEATLSELDESQKADLLITWQWLRNRMWRLAASHGLVGASSGEGTGSDDGSDSEDEADEADELTLDYAVDVAATTGSICRRLSRASMEAHGTGFVEKLYDIASALDARGLPAAAHAHAHPHAHGAALDAARRVRWEGAVRGLYGCVERHRSAGEFAERLRGAVGPRVLEIT
ncbi:hypothetical protein Q5752_000370 [Cryptotrichosporon argae]